MSLGHLAQLVFKTRITLETLGRPTRNSALNLTVTEFQHRRAVSAVVHLVLFPLADQMSA
jgi:hypothetical protein